MLYLGLLHVRRSRSKRVRDAPLGGTIYGNTVTKTTVYLEPEIALDLRRIAAVEGRSQAELIRDALAAYTRGKEETADSGSWGVR